jgi:hypothetical protein
VKNTIWFSGMAILIAVSFLYSQQSSPAVGKVTFVKGNVQKISGQVSSPVRLAQEVAPGDLFIVTEGEKLKLLMIERKVLITVLPVSRIRLTTDGVELIEGSADNLIEQKAGFLNPAPALSPASRQLGGTFVTRGAGEDFEPLNLRNTSSKNTRPTFNWKGASQSKIELKLFIEKSGTDRALVWSQKTTGNSLVFPTDKRDLEKGLTYCWGLYQDNNRVSATACFHTLSETEESSFYKDLAEVERLSGQDMSDLSTKRIITMELLKKYNLLDDLKNYQESN